MHIKDGTLQESELIDQIIEMIDPFYHDNLKKYLKDCKSTIDEHYHKIFNSPNVSSLQFIYNRLQTIYINARTEKAWYPFFNQNNAIYNPDPSLSLDFLFSVSSLLRRINFNFFHDRMGINDIGKQNEPIYFNVKKFGEIKIGVISDTHGYIKESLNLLKKSNINILIHAGNITYEESRSLDKETFWNNKNQPTIDKFYEQTTEINIWKFLKELNDVLNIPVYFVGGNHDYILNQLGIIFGHDKLSKFIKETFTNLHYLYTEMENPIKIPDIQIMGKSVTIWGSGISEWKGPIHDLEVVNSDNKAFQYDKDICFTADTNIDKLLSTLPVNHFLRKEDGGDDTYFNIIITHSPIHISQELQIQTRSTDNPVFGELIEKIFTITKGDMHISGHSHRSHTLEDLDIEPFIIMHNNKEVIIANVPVVNVWGGFEGFAAVIGQFVNDILTLTWNEPQSEFTLNGTDEFYKHLKSELPETVTYSNKHFLSLKYENNTPNDTNIEEIQNLYTSITSNIYKSETCPILQCTISLFDDLNKNKITPEFIKNFGGLNIYDLENTNFWYNHRDKIIGVNWPDFSTVRKSRFLSDNIYDHGIFGNFYLFKPNTFCVNFVDDKNVSHIIEFNNTESIYHSIKIYFYYLKGLFSFNQFLNFCSNKEFCDIPQTSWSNSRSLYTILNDNALTQLPEYIKQNITAEELDNPEYSGKTLKDLPDEIQKQIKNAFKAAESTNKHLWEEHSWNIMILIVYYKAIISHDFRTLLLDCGNAYILEDSSNNSEWGIFDITQSIYTFDKIMGYINQQQNIKNNSSGLNKLGISLMIARVLLKYNGYKNTDFSKLLKEYGIYKFNNNIITTRIISIKKVHVNFIKEFVKSITNMNLLDNPNFRCNTPLSELYENIVTNTINKNFFDATTYPNHLLCKLLYRAFEFTLSLLLVETDNPEYISYNKLDHHYTYTYINTITMHSDCKQIFCIYTPDITKKEQTKPEQ